MRMPRGTPITKMTDAGLCINILVCSFITAVAFVATWTGRIDTGVWFIRGVCFLFWFFMIFEVHELVIRWRRRRRGNDAASPPEGDSEVDRR